jgi:lycopene beta-cyclase
MTPPDRVSNTYDFIFAGGGMAALNLAWGIATSSLKGSSMLIVDRGGMSQTNGAYSFWSKRQLPFTRDIGSSWERLSFKAPGYSQRLHMGCYRYHTLRGRDYYEAVRERLAAFPRVSFLQGSISQLQETPEGVCITVGGEKYFGRYAFDSRFSLQQAVSEGELVPLKMAFRGWEVVAEREVFDTGAVTLMDFRTPVAGDVRFFYVLPEDSRRALVEFTQFTVRPASTSESETALRSYLRRAYGLEPGRDCTTRLRESGSLPVSSQVFPRRSGRHILNIGLNGGRLKPSTGYAFTRIQWDSEAITASLERCGHPFALPPDRQVFSVMDSIMLEVMQRYPKEIPAIFTALFKNNPLERVLRFLDEDASLVEVGQIIASLPPGLFLKVLARRLIEHISKPGARINQVFMSNQKGKSHDATNRATKTRKQHPSLR